MRRSERCHTIFAAYDSIVLAFWWPQVVPPVLLCDEVYEQTGSPDPETQRWYKGRAIVRLTNTDANDPFTLQYDQLRGRADHLQALETKADLSIGETAAHKSAPGAIET